VPPKASVRCNEVSQLLTNHVCLFVCLLLTDAFFPAYAFYGRSSMQQSDQPQTYVPDGSSEVDFEDEADWHDEPNIEELAPRHRSKFSSQALNIEVRPHFFLSFPNSEASFSDTSMAGSGYIT